MKDELQNYLEWPKRYDHIDGTGEMGMGVMLLGFALLSYLQAALPEGSMWRNGFASLLFMYLILIPVLALGYWGGKAIKSHITWPRTGYVAFRRGGTPWWTRVVSTLVVSAGVGAGFACLMVFARRHDSINLPRTGMLAVLVATYGIWVFRMGREQSWKWLIVLFMALGLLVIDLIVPGDVVELFRPVSLLVGLTWLGSGVATLYSYIRHTQPPALEAE